MGAHARAPAHQSLRLRLWDRSPGQRLQHRGINPGAWGHDHKILGWEGLGGREISMKYYIV